MEYSQSRTVVIIPVKGHFDYASACLLSLFKNSPPGTTAIVIDDHSDDWIDDKWMLCSGGKTTWKRFNEPRGLTAAWNAGFEIALADSTVDYIVAANSDLIFSPNWLPPLVYGTTYADLHIVGPLSNAPGVTNASQQVGAVIKGYEVNDHPEAIAATANELRKTLSKTYKPGKINGFCMLGHRKAWQEFSYDSCHVFPPIIPIMPSGRRNPTPLLTGQEDWLGSRPGLRMGVSFGSFVFHYRSVTRGMQHVHGDWTRTKESPNGDPA